MRLMLLFLLLAGACAPQEVKDVPNHVFAEAEKMADGLGAVAEQSTQKWWEVVLDRERSEHWAEMERVYLERKESFTPAYVRGATIILDDRLEKSAASVAAAMQIIASQRERLGRIKTYSEQLDRYFNLPLVSGEDKERFKAWGKMLLDEWIKLEAKKAEEDAKKKLEEAERLLEENKEGEN